MIELKQKNLNIDLFNIILKLIKLIKIENKNTKIILFI